MLRGEWNAELYGPLKEEWDRSEGRDLWVHKNRYVVFKLIGWLDIELDLGVGRMGGFGGGNASDLERFLDERGLKTLLFAGVNADQVRTEVDDQGLGLML